MTKEQVEQKIREILSKDPQFIGAKITITYTDKKRSKAKKHIGR